MLTLDIVDLIAEHVEASPLEYCNYAQVNRDFFRVFTSDRLWRQFDVYGLGSGVYRDFMEKMQKDKVVSSYVWRGNDVHPMMEQEFERAMDENLYVHLGYLVNSRHNSYGVSITNKQLLVKALPLIKWSMIFRVTPELASDHDVGLVACKSHGTNLEWLDDKLKDDKVLVMEALKWDSNVDIWINEVFGLVSERLRQDREVVEQAIRCQATNIPPLYLDNEEIIRSGVSQCADIYIKYWVEPSVEGKLQFGFKEAAGDFMVYQVTAPKTRFRGKPDTIDLIIDENNHDLIIYLLQVSTVDPTGWLQAQHDRIEAGTKP